MRKKNYFLLYPMMGIAVFTIAFIIIGRYCFGLFADKTKWLPHKTNYTAVVVSPATQHAKGKSCTLQIVSIEGEGMGKCIKAYFQSSPYGEEFLLPIGQGVEIESKIARDTSMYARSDLQGTTFIPYDCWQAADVTLESLSAFDELRIKMLQVRESLLKDLRKYIPEQEFAIVAAMTLGDKSRLTKETKDIFSQMGVSHVLALSGLHIGIVFYFVLLIFLPAGTSLRMRRLTNLIAILPIWAFVFLVGLPISAIRAATMITIYALVDALGRRRVSFNILCLACVIILVASPMSLFDIGFQLSFLSVGGILLLYPVLYYTIDAQWLQRHVWLRRLWGISCVSIVAQIATAPLVAYYFGTFSTYFLISNYVVIPLVTLIIYSTIAFFIATPIVVLQQWIGTMLSGCVIFMLKFLTLLSGMPCATISGLHPDCIEVGMLYVVITLFFIWWNKNTANRLKLLLLSLLLLVVYSGFTN